MAFSLHLIWIGTFNSIVTEMQGRRFPSKPRGVIAVWVGFVRGREEGGVRG